MKSIVYDIYKNTLLILIKRDAKTNICHQKTFGLFYTGHPLNHQHLLIKK